MNATMRKFGYPHTLVAEYAHWVVLVRPAQATLGALVLVNRSDATAFAALGGPDFAELHAVVGDIERGLAAFRRYARINYLMLMMVDREVHFHVLPRYDRDEQFDGAPYRDSGWPGAPDLTGNRKLEGASLDRLVHAIRDAWPGRGPGRGPGGCD